MNPKAVVPLLPDFYKTYDPNAPGLVVVAFMGMT